MRSFLQDEIAAILVPFTDGGEPFMPTASSATWSLRDHDGAVILSAQAITLGVADVETLIQVPAIQNTITSPREFEKRTLIVNALHGARPWQIIMPYILTPWLNHTVTMETVRSLAGLSSSELADGDVDIYSAYKWMEAKLTSALLTTALASGTKDETDVNRAIASKALLEALPAVINRNLKRKTDGSLEAEKFGLDMALLRDALAKNIDEVVQDIGGVVQATPSLFSFGLPTDVITGV
jgi:hypothetical protein